MDTSNTNHTVNTNNKSKLYLKAGLAVLIFALVIVLATKLIPTNQEKPLPSSASLQQVPTAFISVDSKGFMPSTITIKKGTKVIWRNVDDDTYAQIAANPYPTHSSLPSLVSPQLSVDQQYSYTFNQTGTYGYHDEESPSNSGQVIVE